MTKVYFVKASAKDDLDTIHKKIYSLYVQAGFDNLFSMEDLIAIKIHFGEKGNTTHIPANYFNKVIRFKVLSQTP